MNEIEANTMQEQTRLNELLALAEALLCECRIWISCHGGDGTERFELIGLIDNLEKQINDELQKAAR